MCSVCVFVCVPSLIDAPSLFLNFGKCFVVALVLPTTTLQVITQKSTATLQNKTPFNRVLNLSYSSPTVGFFCRSVCSIKEKTHIGANAHTKCL